MAVLISILRNEEWRVLRTVLWRHRVLENEQNGASLFWSPYIFFSAFFEFWALHMNLINPSDEALNRSAYGEEMIVENCFGRL